MEGLISIFIFTLMSFSIFQWNAQSISAHGHEMKKIIFDMGDKAPEVICIQETWLKSHLRFNLPGYSSIRRDRNDDSYGDHGGLVIFIRNGVAYNEVEIPVGIQEGVECQIVRIFTGNTYNSYIDVVNLYNPCLQLNDDCIVTVLNSMEGKAVVCGDFNAYNKMWGSIKNDKNGRIVEDIFASFDYVVLNDGRGTRYDAHTGKLSHLDLTFVSSSLAAVSDWDVIDGIGSDHFPILSTFYAVPVIYNNSVPYYKWSFKKADWESFQSNCSNEFNDWECKDSVEENEGIFRSKISNAADLSFRSPGGGEKQ
jgi:hypothetical protein